MSTRQGRLPEGRWTAVVATVLLLPALVLWLASREPDPGVTSEDDQSSQTPAAEPVELDESGMEHVHGLGVNPADGRLYAATHFGMFAVTDDGTATRVGDAQDTMGFTVTGPDTFLGSGHPDFTQDDEPLLGLIESTDAGRTWTPLSLRGDADFHALSVSHDRVWGFDATSGTLMSTTDRKQWQSLSRLPLRDFAVNPADADVLLATTQQGPVRSDDGGRTWQASPGAPALVVLAWPRQDVLYGADTAGVVHVSEDAGGTWSPVGETGGAPEAMTVTGTQPLTVYVAVGGTGIVVSDDGGLSFTDLHRQP